MPNRQCWRRALKYVIGGVDDEAHGRNRSAQPRCYRHDAMAQDMIRGVDLSSPDMVPAEITRGDIEAALATATLAAPADFTTDPV